MKGTAIRRSVFSFLTLVIATASFTYGQTSTEPSPAVTPQPAVSPTPAPAKRLTSLKGIELGMTVEQVKSKLGTPEVEDATGMVFTPGKGETVQIGLNPEKKVRTVAAIYAAGSSGVPTLKEVFGGEPADDGEDVYKMERYPDAGYWLAYSRTNSKDTPLTVITMRKIR